MCELTYLAITGRTHEVTSDALVIGYCGPDLRFGVGRQYGTLIDFAGRGGAGEGREVDELVEGGGGRRRQVDRW